MCGGSEEVLGYKFRLYPSKTIEAKLLQDLDLCRWLYNRPPQEQCKNRRPRTNLMIRKN
ncbi:MAG: helix-turn-helix domain-containing protein [Methanobacteriales archaeon]|nr:helix-turn-helix domain-containing protein [Methanothermobacter sp.]